MLNYLVSCIGGITAGIRFGRDAKSGALISFGTFLVLYVTMNHLNPGEDNTD